MKSLVLVSCLVLSATAFPGYASYSGYGAGYNGPPAPLAQDGRVVDTPEVAHAKAAHLATHAAEAAKTNSVGYSGDYSDDYGSSYFAQAQPAYHGPPAPLAHDGRVLDTPEVAHAKAAHFAAHADQISKIAHLSYAKPYPQPQCRNVLFSAILNVVFCAPQWYGGGHPGAYGGHAAPAPLGPDGRVVDTPEVAQLKAAHLAALADANARAPKGLGPAGPYPGPAGSYAPGNYAHYSGPPAPLGPDGRVVDTAEVQQAKAVHFSLYNAEAQRAPSVPAGPPAPVPHNPSWNPAGGYNPSNPWG
ncbi:pupal cuticle protein-like [Colletes latitarsis]|uniref:pupal cuticle protein-like n=1 Tax=Colletes latitarsis TaxID=2605962 RepID=UPI004036C8BD